MSIEAMKQALDALELHGKQYPFTVAAQGYCLDAITTLRTAIAEAESRATEQAEFDAAHESLEKQAGIHVSQQSAPVQEPVEKHYVDGGHIVYPAAQRQWVGLTEEEHTQIAVDAGCMSSDWVFYGAAVERALREKNEKTQYL